ncbi:MAG: hypothetical protein AB8B99_07865 [Phormidesmis sp.]
MSILLLVVFPFAGLTPLIILLLVAILGWGVQMANIVLGATQASDPE